MIAHEWLPRRLDGGGFTHRIRGRPQQSCPPDIANNRSEGIKNELFYPNQWIWVRLQDDSRAKTGNRESLSGTMRFCRHTANSKSLPLPQWTASHCPVCVLLNRGTI